jgi:hypothetical protein
MASRGTMCATMEGSCDDVDDLCERVVLREWANGSCSDSEHPCEPSTNGVQSQRGAGRSRICQSLQPSSLPASLPEYMAMDFQITWTRD